MINLKMVNIVNKFLRNWKKLFLIKLLTALMPDNCWQSMRPTEMNRGTRSEASLRICRSEILSPPSLFIASNSSWTSKSPRSHVRTVDIIKIYKFISIENEQINILVWICLCNCLVKWNDWRGHEELLKMTS